VNSELATPDITIVCQILVDFLEILCRGGRDEIINVEVLQDGISNLNVTFKHKNWN
jgi:hypothetical protein